MGYGEKSTRRQQRNAFIKCRCYKPARTLVDQNAILCDKEQSRRGGKEPAP